MLSPPLRALLEGAQPSPWKPPARSGQEHREILRALQEDELSPLRRASAWRPRLRADFRGLPRPSARRRGRHADALLCARGSRPPQRRGLGRGDLELRGQGAAERQGGRGREVREDPRVLAKAPEALRGSQDFVKKLVWDTKAWWLVEFATEELRNDAAPRKECQQLAGKGVLFSYYQSHNAFWAMRHRFKASGASVPRCECPGGRGVRGSDEAALGYTTRERPGCRGSRAFDPFLGLQKLGASKLQGHGGTKLSF